ncbi:MAG: hypothetical protein JWN86_2474 [Planctomycetota bacterium]|nr:hypothetical protein [Planctomycetota bacterium]
MVPWRQADVQCLFGEAAMIRRTLTFSLTAIAITTAWSRAVVPPESIRLVDVAAESGIRFRFDTGSRNKHDLPEIMGGGVALIDVDGDGRLDIYLCNGGPIVAEPGRADPPCRLFLNLGNWRFRNITDSANAPGPSYAMGVAVGDFDGDGKEDLFVTGWRDQRLYKNLGSGRFSDVTAKAGLSSRLWSTSAAFADLDGDGDLDLYVCNYVDYNPATAPFCAAPDGKPDFCGPEEFPAQPDRLYRNNGDGTFSDVADDAGISDPEGRGLSVLIADMVGDSRPDLFVANDGTACRLYENLGGLKFQEVGAKAGVAFDGDGQSLAAMGLALGDLDGDGRVEIFVTNFLGRSTVAFQNQGEGQFVDGSRRLGLTAETRSILGFGIALADFDGDGDLDLLQANGHVLDRERLGEPFAMKPLIMKNERGHLIRVSSGSDPFLSSAILGRGVAVGDLDGDGRPDAVVTAIDAPVAVLKNVSDSGRFVTLDLIGKSRRPAVGATVRVKVVGRTIVRSVVAGGSYLSASDRKIYLATDPAHNVDEVEVTWPSGLVERFRLPKKSLSARLVEGNGVR